ncbi:MAG: hypothetical protein FWG87_03070 [Defluviitaleaceae bacterium]|nr:hypothetical protein [Defluviitaleaceae bacterium]
MRGSEAYGKRANGKTHEQQTTRQTHKQQNTHGFVGDGLVRPEVTSLCVNARYPSRIDERAYLGAGKPAPYSSRHAKRANGKTHERQNDTPKRHAKHTNDKTPRQTHEQQNTHGFVGDGLVRPEVT